MHVQDAVFVAEIEFIGAQSGRIAEDDVVAGLVDEVDLRNIAPRVLRPRRSSRGGSRDVVRCRGLNRGLTSHDQFSMSSKLEKFNSMETRSLGRSAHFDLARQGFL